MGAMFGVNHYCRSQSEMLRTYVFEGEQLGKMQDMMSVNVTVSKEWEDTTLHPDIPVGAQYDAVLYNNSDFEFNNWTAEIIFSEDMFIDSSWNGRFGVSGNKLLFKAQEETASAKPHNVATFGAVMYSRVRADMTGCVIKGYRIINPTELTVFWTLIMALGLYVIVLVTHIIIQLRVRRYKKQMERDSEIIKQTMNTFTGFIDAKDSYTKGHSARVAEYSAELARRMKLKDEEVNEIYYISLMHDCGKIGIPDSVLKKPGKLTDEEYEIIKSHTTIGNDVLSNFTAIKAIRDGAHYHHERYDGTGYPTGLKGGEIPVYARIICVADTYDAMSSDRCYRAKLSREKILSELTENAGKQFDPEIVVHMIDMINDGFTDMIQRKYES